MHYCHEIYTYFNVVKYFAFCNKKVFLILFKKKKKTPLKSRVAQTEREDTEKGIHSNTGKKQKHRPVIQNRKPREKPAELWSPNP